MGVKNNNAGCKTFRHCVLNKLNKKTLFSSAVHGGILFLLII